MFKWFTMLVTAASLCLFSSPIQCSLPVQSHDCVLKKTAKAPGAADPSGPLKKRPEVQVDDDMADSAGGLQDDYDRILNEIGGMRYDEAERAAPTELEGFWVRIPHDGRGFPYIRFKGQFFSLAISPDTNISGVFRLDGSESEFLGRKARTSLPTSIPWKTRIRVCLWSCLPSRMKGGDLSFPGAGNFPEHTGALKASRPSGLTAHFNWKLKASRPVPPPSL